MLRFVFDIANNPELFLDNILVSQQVSHYELETCDHVCPEISA